MGTIATYVAIGLAGLGNLHPMCRALVATCKWLRRKVKMRFRFDGQIGDGIRISVIWGADQKEESSNSGPQARDRRPEVPVGTTATLNAAKPKKKGEKGKKGKSGKQGTK